MDEPVVITSKEKILDAAEHAFAELGFDGASMRHIVQSAEVNLATVYYYFGSKEGLMTAVFQRVFAPQKVEQLERLLRLKTESQGQTCPIEAILQAVLEPAMRLTESEPSSRNEMARRLIGRIVTDPNPKTQELLRCQHQEVRTIYMSYLHEALPELPLIDLEWRMEFIWGALAFILCNPDRVGNNPCSSCGVTEITNVFPQMIAFFATGLRAPAVTK